MFTADVYGKRYQVKFNHIWTGKVPEAWGPKITYCSITRWRNVNPELNAEVVLYGSGVARCSDYDQFQRSVGRKISLTRALEDAGLDKFARSVFWAEYRKKCKV